MKLINKLILFSVLPLTLASCTKKEEISYEEFLKIAKETEIPPHKAVKVEAKRLITIDEEIKTDDKIKANYKDQFGKWVLEDSDNKDEDFLYLVNTALNYRSFTIDDSEDNRYYKYSDGETSAEVKFETDTEGITISTKGIYQFDKYGQIIELEFEESITKDSIKTVTLIQYEASYFE